MEHLTVSFRFSSLAIDPGIGHYRPQLKVVPSFLTGADSWAIVSARYSSPKWETVARHDL